MASLVFAHPSGDIQVTNFELSSSDEWAQVSFQVPEFVWDSIYLHDVFGARSRRRLPNDLSGAGPVRVRLTGPTLGLTNRSAIPADLFELTEAMRPIDAHQATWQGVVYGPTPAWSGALSELLEIGFSVRLETEDAVVLEDEFGTRVELEEFATNQLVTAVFSHPLNTQKRFDDLVNLCNSANSKFLIGTLALDKDRISVRVGLPIIDSNQTDGTLSPLVPAMLSLLQETLPIAEKLSEGEIDLSEAVLRLTE